MQNKYVRRSTCTSFLVQYVASSRINVLIQHLRYFSIHDKPYKILWKNLFSRRQPVSKSRSRNICYQFGFCEIAMFPDRLSVQFTVAKSCKRRHEMPGQATSGFTFPSFPEISPRPFVIFSKLILSSQHSGRSEQVKRLTYFSLLRIWNELRTRW